MSLAMLAELALRGLLPSQPLPKLNRQAFKRAEEH